MSWLNILVEVSHNYYDLERKDSKLSTEIWHGMQYMFLKRTCRRKQKFYRYVSSKISANEYGRLNIETCRKHALFCFPVSFLHSLSAHCGARDGTIVQTYSTPEYRHVRKTWVWGSFPFPRASKLEMSCSILGYVSKKWKSTFGNPCESKIDHEGIFLTNLATEYKSCKDKETNKAIWVQLSKQKKNLTLDKHCGTVAFLYLAQHQMYLSHEWMLPKLM